MSLGWSSPPPDRWTPGKRSMSSGSPILAAARGDEHFARALWALAHGLVDLELSGRFPPGADLDATWRTALSGFTGG
jgi:hypothetical protein